MGARTDGDGRLDLDDLGSVIEAASSADSAETLDDGLGRPSVAERLEDVGVLPWLRAHRPLVASLAVGACVGLVVIGVHQASQPPPFDPQVVAGLTALPVPVISDWLPETRRGESGLVSTRVLVTGVPAGDTVAVTGITGPGLGATRGGVLTGGWLGGSAPDPDPRVVAWTVAATVDCADPRALTAVEGDYGVTLARTDPWGRTVQATVPLPEGDVDWSSQVRLTCWSRAVQSGLAVDEVAARADPTRNAVSIGLVLSNSSPLDLVAGSEAAAFEAQGVRVGQSFRVGLAAGLGAQTEVLLTVTSCDRASIPLVGVPQSRDGGTVALVPGLPLLVTAADRRTATQVALVLDAEQAAAVQSAIDAVCAGAPDIDVRAVGVPVVQALGGPADERQMRILLGVRRSSGEVAEAEVQGDAGLPSGFSARTTPEAAEPVEIVWRYTCANTPAPPRVSVTVTDGIRAWPWAGVLDDAVLARAVLRGCAAQDAGSLAGAGWSTRTLAGL